MDTLSKTTLSHTPPYSNHQTYSVNLYLPFSIFLNLIHFKTYVVSDIISTTTLLTARLQMAKETFFSIAKKVDPRKTSRTPDARLFLRTSLSTEISFKVGRCKLIFVCWQRYIFLKWRHCLQIPYTCHKEGFLCPISKNLCQSI